MNTKKFAKAILRAQKIKEDSFDYKACNKEREKWREKYPDEIPFIDFYRFYCVNDMEAAMLSCKENNIPEEFAYIIYLLNRHSWNDVQIWSEQQGD